MFAPGCARLATSPTPTGSLTWRKTIGMVLVASLATRATRWLMAQGGQAGAGPARRRGRAGDRVGPPPSGTPWQSSGPRGSRGRAGLAGSCRPTRAFSQHTDARDLRTRLRVGGERHQEEAEDDSDDAAQGTK